MIIFILYWVCLCRGNASFLNLHMLGCIFLPLICKIYYVNMKFNYVNIMLYVNIFLLHVSIIMFHVHINKSHNYIILLNFDIIFISCRGKKHWIINITARIGIWKDTADVNSRWWLTNSLPFGSISIVCDLYEQTINQSINLSQVFFNYNDFK